MLYIVNEMTFSGYNVVNLDLLYIIAILLGILVIISKNPIVSVLFLIGLFLCISAYLILTGLNFIGLSYLLVYVGAVTVRMNNFAALVRIQLYKVLLIIKNFLFKTMFYKNKLPSLKFKRGARLAFA
jgi:NADH-ubiquinone oxidoreductase chain 6